MCRPLVLACALAMVIAARLGAQCPDGTPPPCVRAPAPAPTSVAVLYFDNASRDTNDAYLADGLTEAIIIRLGQVERLQVASRFAVNRYRTQTSNDPAILGRALGVAHLVSGTVRRIGGRLLVTVELLRASTGREVWANQFDRSDADLLAIEQDVAHAVATAIAGRLLPDERASVAARPTRDPAAYDHFLRGNFNLAQRTPRALIRAVEEYQHALERDPAFVQARARMALGYGLLIHTRWANVDTLLAPGFAAADGALAQDPRSSDGWMARAFLLEFRDPRAFGGVLPAFERAVTLDPRNAEAWFQYSWALLCLGHDSAGIAASLRALDIEPGRPVSLYVLSLANYFARRFDDARRWSDSALAVDPGFASALAQRSTYRLRSGDLTGARADAEAAIRAGAGALFDPQVTLAVLAAQAGDTAGARARLDSLRDQAGGREHFDWRVALSLAASYVALGGVDGALDVLERAEPHGLALGYYLRSPDYDALRGLPRFRQLADEMRPREAPR